MGEELTMAQKEELGELLGEFRDVFRDEPGRKNLISHDLITGLAHPVRLPPYRVPHAYRQTVKKELQEMLARGIIEPSDSVWGHQWSW